MLAGHDSEAFIFEPKNLVSFPTAWRWQREWQKTLFKVPHGSQAVWLLQHSHCYTLGRGASKTNLLFDQNESPFDLYRVDRGGEVTHHLPGQLVVYLVLDLRRFRPDLDWYLRQLEQLLIDVLHELGLSGQRIDGLTGVWFKGYKVASVGIGCRRWITQHGLALNIDCDLKGFQEIVPCGLAGYPVGKLDSWIPGLKIADVQPLMKRCLIKRFDLLPKFEDFSSKDLAL